MKVRDILGGQNILWPLLHIFRSQYPNNPRMYAPEWILIWREFLLLRVCSDDNSVLHPLLGARL